MKTIIGIVGLALFALAACAPANDKSEAVASYKSDIERCVRLGVDLDYVTAGLLPGQLYDLTELWDISPERVALLAELNRKLENSWRFKGRKLRKPGDFGTKKGMEFILDDSRVKFRSSAGKEMRVRLITMIGTKVKYERISDGKVLETEIDNAGFDSLTRKYLAEELRYYTLLTAVLEYDLEDK